MRKILRGARVLILGCLVLWPVWVVMAGASFAAVGVWLPAGVCFFVLLLGLLYVLGDGEFEDVHFGGD